MSKSGTFSIEASKNSAGNTGITVHPGITAAGYTIYYLDESGKLYGWGYNCNNILDAGVAVTSVTKPRFIMDNVARISVCKSNDNENSNFAAITAAVLTLDGEIYSIGSNGPALGRTAGAPGWGIVDFSGDAVDISVGFDHLLVLDKSGVLWGIGNNSYGQLGTANYGNSTSSFQRIATNVTDISAGRRNTAYLNANGDCFILGDGRWNKFNNGTDNFTTPYKLLSGVSYIESGEHEMILVTEDGKLYYAGWRDLASFTQGSGSHGAALLESKNVASASILFSNMLILMKDGTVRVYGLNQGNGIGGATVNGVTADLDLGGTVKGVAAGYGFSAFLMNDGKVKILGENNFGQHGNGSTSEVTGFSTVTVS